MGILKAPVPKAKDDNAKTPPWTDPSFIEQVFSSSSSSLSVTNSVGRIDESSVFLELIADAKLIFPLVLNCFNSAFFSPSLFKFSFSSSSSNIFKKW